MTTREFQAWLALAGLVFAVMLILAMLIFP
jgi:hypothetical protein